MNVALARLLHELHVACLDAEEVVDYCSGYKVGKTMAKVDAWKIRNIIKQYQKEIK